MLIEIHLIAAVVAIACALPGIFLVLRGTTMLSDAITHTVLLGIVLAFFVTDDLNSPLLLVGATLTGVATVWVIEALQQTKLLSNDAAIGVVFPLFFSIAIILITRYAGSVHLDTDSVLMGELAFAPFKRAILFGRDIGPLSLWTMLGILLLNAGALVLFYKEIKITTFDAAFAAVLGFSPVLLHYGLMTLVSLTAVGAYDSVGSVLVVGFMVGPALTGYLMTNQLKHMIWVTIVAALVNSFVGIQLAFSIDTSLVGMIAVVTGITCLIAFVVSPSKGLIQSLRSRQQNKRDFDAYMSKKNFQ